ncbi:unnamed protein product [Caenorhabditis bovis]|uniref:CX domain-containing protein n=1 Tax=Caenorhabditis bovis TaxID=2654633 RepID=A0A8S1EBB4_9PELO|nr:unnamed protein product [Caenorhabditis bovis]
MVSSLTIKRLLSSTVDGTAHLCVYDANHNGDDLTVTISCPTAAGCCEKGCCKLPAHFISDHSNVSAMSEEPINSASHVNETILLITLTIMVFFFGCVSILFIFRKVQNLRDKVEEPDFVYHAYRQPSPNVSEKAAAKNMTNVILTDYRDLSHFESQ